MTKTFHIALAALAMALVPLAATAQSANDYPNKPIRFIAPIPAGGSTDVLTRDIARRLQERWGQPTVVENKPGSTGSIGAALVARAPADGYTLLLVNSGHVINGHIYARLPYDPIKDFVPVVHATSIAMGLFVNPSVPAKNLTEFLALARAKPGALSFTTSGNGGAGHLGGEAIKAATGIDMVHVPYRGSAPAIADVVAGQVQVSIADVPLALPHVRSGALRPIALAASQRSAALPDMPTFAELGVPNIDFSVWVGFLAPAGTPKAIVDKLNREIVSIVREPAMAARLVELGFEVVGSTPADFEQTIKRDHEAYGIVVRNAKIRIE
ncbi:MAG: LacI family transcriptional regulator [Variovorax paradoxus]|nr:MAG: LacI family transcriptional regulator [Variovorax paradoxus]PZQ04170.1 MAG: LacI family transcriptional regulator [Variovorax paradoxus]